jgi:hypothetical protein
MKQGDIWLINLDPSVGAEIKKTKDSSADCFQVRSVSFERFVRRIGSISEYTSLFPARWSFHATGKIHSMQPAKGHSETRNASYT